MAPFLRALWSLVFCTPMVVYAQAAIEFDDSFIEEQLELLKNEPSNRVVLDIDLPIEEVFSALLSGLPNYSDDVIELRFDNSQSLKKDSIGVGSRRFSTMDNEGILVQKIVAYDPPNTFSYFTEMSRSTVSIPIDFSLGHYELSVQADGRTRAEVSALYKASSRLTGFLVRLLFNRAFEQDFKKAEAYLNSL